MKTIKFALLIMFALSALIVSAQEEKEAEESYDEFAEVRAKMKMDEEQVYQFYQHGVKNSSCLTLLTTVQMSKMLGVTVDGMDNEKILQKATEFANNDKDLIDLVNKVREIKGRGKSVSTGANYNRAFKSKLTSGGTIERTYLFKAGTPAEIKVIDDLGLGVDIEVFDADGKIVKLDKQRDCKSYTFVSWTPPKESSYKVIVKNKKENDPLNVLLITN